MYKAFCTTRLLVIALLPYVTMCIMSLYIFLFLFAVTKQQNFRWVQIKTAADYKLNLIEIIQFVFERVENNLEK